MAAKQMIGIKDVCIRIYKTQNNTISFEDFYMSDAQGNTPVIPLYAPAICESMIKDNQQDVYETYHLEIRKKGFETRKVIGIQIFAGQHSKLSINMVPMLSTQSKQIQHIDIIPDHQLSSLKSRVLPTFTKKTLKSSIKLPTTIIVHQGAADCPAEDLVIPFIDYLKNVICSEVYPTWPYACLKALILAWTSLVIKCISTSFYRKKGYAFDITNQPSIDPCFIKNRNIYTSISCIIDETLYEYFEIQDEASIHFLKSMLSNPWHLLDLANHGYSCKQILTSFTKQQLCIKETKDRQIIPKLRHKTKKRKTRMQLQQEVARLVPQVCLYHSIHVEIKECSCQDIVKQFQSLFDLNADGIIGKRTMLEIYRVSALVNQLQNFSIEHEFIQSQLHHPHSVINIGCKGKEVKLLQCFIAALALFYDEIRPVAKDAYFGPQLELSIKAFQRYFQLKTDGIMHPATWNCMETAYQAIQIFLFPDYLPPPCSSLPFHLFDKKPEVCMLQQALLQLKAIYDIIPDLDVNGIFDVRTKQAVKTFQKMVSSDHDGYVDKTCWNQLFKELHTLKQEDLPPALLHNKQQMQELQSSLITLARSYSTIPSIPIDGAYTAKTKQAIIAVQRLLGLPIDGQLHLTTWKLIQQMSKELSN